MSRIQPSYLPTHVGDAGSNGSSTGLVPVTAHATPLSTLEHDPTADRGELWIQVSTPKDLKGIKDATVHVLLQIQGKLSKCRLTKAEEGMKDQIFNGLDKIADILLIVLRAHRDAASGIKHIIDFHTHGDIAQTVEGHLASAWNSVEKASEEFNGVKGAILKQSKLLKEGTDPPPGFFKTQAHKAVNRELPGKSSFPSLLVAMTSIVVNSAAAAEIAQRFPGAVATTNILGALAIIFGSAMQAANYIGNDAAIYEPKARETTQKALDCIDKHLLQFCRALSSLQLYWTETHSTEFHDAARVANPLELLRIVTVLEKHVDDCLVVVSAIQNLSLPMTVTPTRLDIDDERNWITHGVFDLPSGRY